MQPNFDPNTSNQTSVFGLYCKMEPFLLILCMIFTCMLDSFLQHTQVEEEHNVLYGLQQEY